MAIEIKLIHDSGINKSAYEGFSWTGLFFGPLVPMFRGDGKWLAIGLMAVILNVILCGVVIGFFTTPIWWIVFAINYNEWHKNDLLLKGFRIA